MLLRCNPLIAAVIRRRRIQSRAGGGAVSRHLGYEWENGVVNIDDVADPARLVTSPTPVAPIIKNFSPFIAIADIVSVNGKPAKGLWVDGAEVSRSFQAPRPVRILETFFGEVWSIFVWRFSKVTPHALARL
jgi:hypothetical protein